MASSLNEKKIREGLQLLKEAEKCLQTSWLKWKPDYDSAADKFTKAGTSFKVGKSYDQAKGAFLKAADAHSKNNSLYHSGKALEQAGAMLKEMKRIEEAAELLERAGSLFQENGTPDTAAMVLIKAAKGVDSSQSDFLKKNLYVEGNSKMCEGTNLKKAVELYEMAGGLREMDDKLREATEPYNKATQLLIKQQKFEEVVNSLVRQLELFGRIGNSAMQYKIILGLVVVHLHDGDYVAADKCFKDGFEVPGFGTSDEAEAIEDLLDAYDKSDAESIKASVAKPLFRNLDNELSKLARDLKPSEEFNISQQPTELRLLSNDIAKLRVDETKPGGDASGQRLELDDDEEFEQNPLGSEQKGESSTTTEQTDKTEDTSRTEKENEVGTFNEEEKTSSGEVGPATDTLTNDQENEPSPDNVEVDDFESEGGLC